MPSHSHGKALQKGIRRPCTFVPYGEESLQHIRKEDIELHQKQKRRKDRSTENLKEEKKPEDCEEQEEMKGKSFR